MESTGEYWRPVFNILEANFDDANAAHIKNVPGRKLILRMPNGFELLQHGLVRASFIPAVEQRDGDLVRHRANFIRERVNLDNRVQKVLEAANIAGLCCLGCHGRIRTCHAGGDCGCKPPPEVIAELERTIA